MRVVCINDDWPFHLMPDEFKNVTYPVKNGVYTVRDDFVVKGYDCRWLRFDEIRNPVSLPDDNGVMMEACFPHPYFRPLDEKRIDVFRKLLVPIKSKVS